MSLDIVLRGGQVYDGLGNPPVQADVGIKDDRIEVVGRIDDRGVEEIDTDGLIVSPGFIDIHSHSDFTLLVDPRARSAIHQGVTTEVVGNCGFGCFPIHDPALAAGSIYGVSKDVEIDWTTAAGYLARLEEARPAVNVLTLVPNSQLRLSTVGMSDKAASTDAIAAMERELEAALEAGAWGYSTGLEYPSESAATEHELQALCRCAHRRGGLYATHTRDRDGGAVEAVDEAVRCAEATGAKLQISHLLPRSGHEAGLLCLERVEKARDRGIDVAFDMHTRRFGTTYLSAALPAWARTGDAGAIAARLADPAQRDRMRNHRSILSAGGDWGRVVLLDSPRWPEYARKDISAIASERGQDAFDAVCDLLAGVVDDLSVLMVIIHAYSAEQQHEIFAHSLCTPASDATTLAPDGPLAGSAFHGAYTWASWFFREMVVRTGRLKPEEAIRKLTSQQAGRIGLANHGLLSRGARADVVAFDPDEFAPQGTTFVPNRLATGMKYVIVNGVVTLREGELTGQRAGQVIRFPGRR